MYFPISVNFTDDRHEKISLNLVHHCIYWRNKMAFCSKCGTQLTDGAEFCASCGTSTGGTVSEPKKVTKKENASEKPPSADAKDKLNAGKEKVNAGINKLPFRKLAEEKIPAGARAKVPLLDKAIPFANLIVCGLAVVLVVIIIAAAGGGNSPKKLAKETYNLTQQALKVGTDFQKAASLAQKSAKLQVKVAKLSEKKMAIYLAEVARLTSGLASDIVSGITGGAAIVSAWESFEPQSPLFRFAASFDFADLKFWEIKVTETDAAKAPGYIMRGMYNLKVTGPLSRGELVSIVAAIKAMERENPSQLVRLDLSATTDLKTIPKFDQVNIGSVVLPDGLESIGENAFWNCPLFEINPIPSSVKRIDDGGFFLTYLTRIVLPVSYDNRNGDSIRGLFSSPFPSTAVFSEEHEVANLFGFGQPGESTPITIVFPSTIKEIKGKYRSTDMALHTGIDTMYFYGETPPKVNTKQEMFFSNIKTIYVPASAVKDYEDAYFSIGKIDVKALPIDRVNFSYWLQPVSADRNAIIRAYNAALNEYKAAVKKFGPPPK
jgi:hypothetical protein